MADISITREHHFSAEEVEKMMQKLADGLVAKHGGSYSWSDDELTYKTAGLKACVTQGDTDVCIDVELGLLMKGLKGILKKEIDGYLDKLLQ